MCVCVCVCVCVCSEVLECRLVVFLICCLNWRTYTFVKTRSRIYGSDVHFHDNSYQSSFSLFCTAIVVKMKVIAISLNRCNFSIWRRTSCQTGPRSCDSNTSASTRLPDSQIIQCHACAIAKVFSQMTMHVL